MKYFFISLFLVFSQPAWANLNATSEDSSFFALFVKTILAMVLVLALLFVWLKYVLPKMTGIKNKSSNIQVLEKINLEPRKSLFVVKLGKKKIVIGASENGLSKIDDWED